MKKVFSLLLTVCFVFACIPFTASAKAQVRIEKAVDFDDYAYIRFGKNVVGVSEDFYIRIDGYYSPDEPRSVRLGTDDLQIFTEDRLEVFLPVDDCLSVRYDPVHVHGLVLSDGTTADYTIEPDEDSIFGSPFLSPEFSYPELHFEMQDALTVYVDFIDQPNAFYTAVGSKWKPDFTGDRAMTDKYLRRHIELTAEGIGLEKQGNKYVFTSVGDGTVSIVIGGHICHTVHVCVREKQEIKRTMIPVAFENSLLWGMAFGFWLGPLALVAALPITFFGGVLKVVRMLLA